MPALASYSCFADVIAVVTRQSRGVKRHRSHRDPEAATVHSSGLPVPSLAAAICVYLAASAKVAQGQILIQVKAWALAVPIHEGVLLAHLSLDDLFCTPGG